MKLKTLFESLPSRWKAGAIPYFIGPSQDLHVLLVTSTNPAFGGDKPAVAKGRPDVGETPVQCAVREVHEETGILLKDPLLLTKRKVDGLKNTFTMHVFTARCQEMEQHAGDGEGIPQWFSINEALSVVRAEHKVFLQDLLHHLAKHEAAKKTIRGMAKWTVHSPRMHCSIEVEALDPEDAVEEAQIEGGSAYSEEDVYAVRSRRKAL